MGFNWTSKKLVAVLTIVGSLSGGCANSPNSEPSGSRPIVRPARGADAVPGPDSQASGATDERAIDHHQRKTAAGGTLPASPAGDPRSSDDSTKGHSDSSTSPSTRAQERVGFGQLPDGTKWELYAEIRESGEACERFRFFARLGGGGGSSCGRPLPLGHSQTLSSSHHAVDGPVTTEAVKVVVSSRSGSSTVVEPFGGELGFGRAYYVAFPPRGPLDKIVAYNAADRVVGEIRFNTQEQDALMDQVD